jgi:NAD(P)-dependent dehydrogenase (short-subunit alcohol dehydrogenase family)
MTSSTQKIVVTGAGSGIGRETALRFATRGAVVAILDLDGDAAMRTEKDICDAGGDAVSVCCDVSNPESVADAFKSVLSRIGHVDVAVNAAGIVGARAQDVAHYDITDFDRVIAVNLKGVFLCMRAELEHMSERGNGAIVNVASGAGLIGARAGSAYSASKHGVVGLTKSAALEYAGTGIRVNAVCPSVIDTSLSVGRMTREQREYWETITPMQRIGTPSEVAEACLWLCDDASSYVTGVAMPVDGGLVAQ